MAVYIKHIGRTPLNPDAYLKLIKKYSKTKLDIYITFDKRLKNCFASYDFNPSSRKHIIQVSVQRTKFVDPVATIYLIIASTLHEIRHLNQREELGKQFDSKKYNCMEDIGDENVSDFFSLLEVDARMFENKYVLEAVELYKNYCK